MLTADIRHVLYFNAILLCLHYVYCGIGRLIETFNTMIISNADRGYSPFCDTTPYFRDMRGLQLKSRGKCPFRDMRGL